MHISTHAKAPMKVFTIHDDRIFHPMMWSFATIVEDIDITQLDTHER